MVAQKLGLVWTWSFLTAISYAAKQTYLCCAEYASSLLFLFFFLSFLLNILCDILPALLMLILSHCFSLTQMIENCCLKEGGPGAEIPFLFLSIQSLGLVFFPNQIATFSTVSASVSEPSEMTFPNAMLHMDAGSLFLMFNHMPYAPLAARLLP